MPTNLGCRAALSRQLAVATLTFEGAELIAEGDYARCICVRSVGQLQFVSSASGMLYNEYYSATVQGHLVLHLPTVVRPPADLCLP